MKFEFQRVAAIKLELQFNTKEKTTWSMKDDSTCSSSIINSLKFLILPLIIELSHDDFR